VVAQRRAGGVQALERLLRVRIRAERDRHVLELLQAAPDARRIRTPLHRPESELPDGESVRRMRGVRGDGRP
jgi:hypothetical protein